MTNRKVNTKIMDRTSLIELKLDKASNTLFETGKKLGRATGTLMVLSFLEALLVFSPKSESFIKMAGVIELDWTMAVMILSLIVSYSLFAKLSMSYHLRLLQIQISCYLELLGSSEKHWYMHYPSSYVLEIIDGKRYGLPPTSSIVAALIPLVGFIFNPYVLYVLGEELEYSTTWIITAGLCLYFWVASFLLYLYIPNWIKRIEASKEYEIIDRSEALNK
jgi:hypothetical protein